MKLFVTMIAICLLFNSQSKAQVDHEPYDPSKETQTWVDGDRLANCEYFLKTRLGLPRSMELTTELVVDSNNRASHYAFSKGGSIVGTMSIPQGRGPSLCKITRNGEM